MKRKFLLWYKKRKFSKAVKKCKGLCAGCRYKKPCSEEREQDLIAKILEENIRLSENVKQIAKERDMFEEELYYLQESIVKVKTKL